MLDDISRKMRYLYLFYTAASCS